jgi:uncharacterized protein involved in copper resistance
VVAAQPAEVVAAQPAELVAAPLASALIRATHVEIHAMQSDRLVMRNMHHAQQSTPSAVAHQRANTWGPARHALINTDLVDHRLKAVRQYVSC